MEIPWQSEFQPKSISDFIEYFRASLGQGHRASKAGRSSPSATDFYHSKGAAFQGAVRKAVACYSGNPLS